MSVPETPLRPSSPATHRVDNQPPPLADVDLFATNRPLVEALEREGGGWARERVGALGRIAGAEGIEWGFQANENPPKLRTHDRYGHRIDEVEFHPAWHRLLQTAVAHEVHALPWRSAEPGAHVARAGLFITFDQVESGHDCPISMTYSAVPALHTEPELAAEWEPRLTSTAYDGVLRPAGEKPGCLAGMGMTEKQGGSDVRANTTRAVACDGGGPGAEYLLTGHKWFCSAPMCDVFLMLAQAEEGLSCFLVPRFTPDGERNVFRIQRLKDKLGNRSNASSEIELDGTWARMVGEPGRGVRTILEMVNHTRLDCVLGSTAHMRWAVANATWHAAHRAAFGRTLIDQPLMANVLADLCVESEAATVTAMRLARAYDEADDDFKRLATAIVKYWVCKRSPAVCVEAAECLGGNGYIEESGMPRLVRESPLDSIWEGSGNVICLDVLRALVRSPATLQTLRAEVAEGAALEPRLAAFAGAL